MPRARLSRPVRNTLAIIAAIAVLIPVAAYAVRHAREVSRQQTCVRNLKILGEACQMYQSDWHDVLVPYGAPFAWPPNGNMWTDLLEPYLKKLDGPVRPGRPRTDVYTCPGVPDDERCFCPEMDYGMNERCGGWWPNKKPVVVPMNSVEHPHATIMIAEVKWLTAGHTRIAASPSDFIPDDITCHMFPTWHRGKGNVLWIDGHVSSMTQEQYNMRDKGPYDGNIWLRLEGPKPPVPGERM